MSVAPALDLPKQARAALGAYGKGGGSAAGAGNLRASNDPKRDFETTNYVQPC